MKSFESRAGPISVALMLPALFLSTLEILYVAFGFAAANRLLDALLAHTVCKIVLSPVVVLGGPFLAFVWNAWKVLHVSAEVVNEEFVVALSVKRLVSHLVCLALAGGLMLLLVSYAFVENFKIVAR